MTPSEVRCQRCGFRIRPNPILGWTHYARDSYVHSLKHRAEPAEAAGGDVTVRIVVEYDNGTSVDYGVWPVPTPWPGIRLKDGGVLFFIEQSLPSPRLQPTSNEDGNQKP